jgi:hypothetical protein
MSSAPTRSLIPRLEWARALCTRLDDAWADILVVRSQSRRVLPINWGYELRVPFVCRIVGPLSLVVQTHQHTEISLSLSLLL